MERHDDGHPRRRPDDHEPLGHGGAGRRCITGCDTGPRRTGRSEEHTSELQSLMRISYAVFCLKKKNNLSKTQLTPIIIILQAISKPSKITCTTKYSQLSAQLQTLNFTSHPL